MAVVAVVARSLSRSRAGLSRRLRSLSDRLEVPLEQSPFMLEARVVEAAASAGSHEEAMAAVVRVINEGWEESVVQLALVLLTADLTWLIATKRPGTLLPWIESRMFAAMVLDLDDVV